MLYLCVLCSASLNFAGFTLSPPKCKDTKIFWETIHL